MVEPGQVLDGKYRIIRLIGEGGMGAVFEGENVRISRRVAIKVLHGAALEKAETVQRFEREAQAAGRIGSDHILEILDLGTLSDGERYMVMEFLQGETLSARIQKHVRLTAEQIVPLIRQALVGLQAAHQAGIIHRDLKPDNIFVVNEKTGIRDYVKIIDFGISKFSALGGDMSMTRTGAVMGTPYYMSPEQAKGASNIDHRSDIYAIGVILYEAVTGEVPFTGNTFNELMFKIVLSEPRPLDQAVPNLDPRFAEVVTRAMAREPGQRYSTATEMVQALDALGYGSKGTVVMPPSPNPGRFEGQVPVVQSPPTAGAVTTGTQGTFATSQQGVPAAPGGKRSLVSVAVGAAVLVLGLGAFAAYRVLGSKKSEEPVPAAEAPASKSVAQQPPVAPPPPAEPRAESASPTPVATPGPTAAPTPEASATASASAAAGVKRVAPPVNRPGRPAAAGQKPANPKSSRDFGY